MPSDRRSGVRDLSGEVDDQQDFWNFDKIGCSNKRLGITCQHARSQGLEMLMTYAECVE